MVRLLISTGEVSGDLQGSLLIQALWRVAKRRGLDLEVLALGGERMQAAGAELLADTSPMGAIGLWEALPLVLPTIRLQARVDRVLKERPPDGVVLIDYMGANVRLGHSLRDRLPDVPITYYIAPQEWAWRIGEGGTKSLLQFTDRILAIFLKKPSSMPVEALTSPGWGIPSSIWFRSPPIVRLLGVRWACPRKEPCCF